MNLHPTIQGQNQIAAELFGYARYALKILFPSCAPIRLANPETSMNTGFVSVEAIESATKRTFNNMQGTDDTQDQEPRRSLRHAELVWDQQS
jgi:hypothetical protein